MVTLVSGKGVPEQVAITATNHRRPDLAHVVSEAFVGRTRTEREKPSQQLERSRDWGPGAQMDRDGAGWGPGQRAAPEYFWMLSCLAQASWERRGLTCPTGVTGESSDRSRCGTWTEGGSFPKGKAALRFLETKATNGGLRL